ncbi:PaaI family thioesterase [Bacillaceae bacterium CLA-AA-H227]|uniref:PaaI family thioesterase n=1 Tax=Robertmurraya yapensis (ex Hitch et al 2024) TaxID=3133160 RepID=A0ACC6SGS6_9BACI
MKRRKVTDMKENITQLFTEILEKGSDEDLSVLQQVLEGLNNKQHTYINSLLHMEGGLKENFFEITIPLHTLVNNPLNILHGGITATVIDTCMGAMVHNALPEGFAAVTSQLNIHYIAPGIGDSITCRARIDHHGTKTMLVSADVFRSDGQKIAQASGTFFILKKNK